MLSFILRNYLIRNGIKYSNTSHVIIYLATSAFAKAFTWFKYIPCYHLSQTHLVCIWFLQHSNTSHVIIYQLSISLVTPCIVNSNTSHVIIYRSALRQRWSYTLIQIHPMLSFIEELSTELITYMQFKYIPCYHLSKLVYDFWQLLQQFKYIPCYHLSI